MSTTTTRRITIRIASHTLPDRVFGDLIHVHLGVQPKSEAIDLIAGDAETAAFTIPIDVV